MINQTKFMDNENEIKNIFKQFKDIIKEPEALLSVYPELFSKAKKLLKNLYDLTVKNDKNEDYDDIILPELVLDDMDAEQLWQQLEIRNTTTWDKFLEKTSRFLAVRNENFMLNCCVEYDDKHSLDDNNEYHQFEMENDFQNEKSKIASIKKPGKKMKSSIVDDKFFKLAEMEEFLKQEDRKEEFKKQGRIDMYDETIDYFKDLSEDDEDENAKYQEFFDGDEEEIELSQEHLEKNRKNNSKNLKSSREFSDTSGEEESENESSEDYNGKQNEETDGSGSEDEHSGFDEEEKSYLNENNSEEQNFYKNESDNDDSENGADSNPENKSTFEQRQERLMQRIKEYEEEILQEKPWQLKGEITATGRPQNSLLEEVLEFDAATRPAPIITETTTLKLEDIIKQRIKDKAWDDVERKYKPIQTPQEYRKKLILDAEKSKESLAKIYEKEYQSQLEKLNPNLDQINSEEEPKQHKEIRDLMKALFIKLDALSNFHYTPKPVAPEPKIITNTPALQMEEVAPVAVSDANILAPEEIKNRPKGDVLGKSEREKTDKKRERRKKKAYQKVLYKRKAEKEDEKLKAGVKLTKKEEKDKSLRNVIKHRNVQKANISTESNSFKSSKSFFTTLQDKTTSNFKRPADKNNISGALSAKKLKL